MSMEQKLILGILSLAAFAGVMGITAKLLAKLDEEWGHRA